MIFSADYHVYASQSSIVKTSQIMNRHNLLTCWLQTAYMHNVHNQFPHHLLLFFLLSNNCKLIAASDQCRPWLLLSQQYLDTSTGIQMGLFKCLDTYGTDIRWPNT